MTKRADWNKRQRRLKPLLEAPEAFQEAVDLFLQQHSQMHTARMAGARSWSYEDEVLNGISDTQFRSIPHKGQHSIAWIIWHIARCEDITLNLLVAERAQVLLSGGWQKKVKSSFVHTGNGMAAQEVAEWGKAIDPAALRAYRQAVGRQTRKTVQALKPEDLDRKPSAKQLELIWREKSMLPSSIGIVNYWSRRTVAGLLLMPATRHLFVHLNEALEIKRKFADATGKKPKAR